MEWVLATPVNFWVGRKIHIGAVKSLMHRAFTMDVLLRFFGRKLTKQKNKLLCFLKKGNHSLGCNAAYFYSVIVVVVSMFDARYHAMIMFETPVMVMTFVMLGRFLENSAKAKTTDAISRLFELKVALFVLLSFFLCLLLFGVRRWIRFLSWRWPTRSLARSSARREWTSSWQRQSNKSKEKGLDVNNVCLLGWRFDSREAWRADCSRRCC